MWRAKASICQWTYYFYFPILISNNEIEALITLSHKNILIKLNIKRTSIRDLQLFSPKQPFKKREPFNLFQSFYCHRNIRFFSFKIFVNVIANIHIQLRSPKSINCISIRYNHAFHHFGYIFIRHSWKIGFIVIIVKVTIYVLEIENLSFSSQWIT